jgi:DNA-binding NarL/FixJ family response regulator
VPFVLGHADVPGRSPTGVPSRRWYAGASDPDAATRRQQARQRLAALTLRERKVAAAVADGSSNAEIAMRLHVSLATVKAHVSRLQ